MNRICNSYYHKYKEVNKKIDENIKGVNYLNNKSLTKFIGNVDEKLINEMILDYLIRKGNLKTVERFIEESRVDPSKLMEDIKIFKEYYEIFNDLKNHKLNKLYEWCTKNKEILLGATGTGKTFTVANDPIKIYILNVLNLIIYFS